MERGLARMQRIGADWGTKPPACSPARWQAGIMASKLRKFGIHLILARMGRAWREQEYPAHSGRLSNSRKLAAPARTRVPSKALKPALTDYPDAHPHATPPYSPNCPAAHSSPMRLLKNLPRRAASFSWASTSFCSRELSRKIELSPRPNFWISALSRAW